MGGTMALIVFVSLCGVNIGYRDLARTPGHNSEADGSVNLQMGRASQQEVVQGSCKTFS
tara:strand:+ start:186 stop:362 length:177 start_codon:yes stop_codon:yes gene_type:complete